MQQDQIDFEPLDIMCEECAETIQAVSKIRRFGFDNHNPMVTPVKTNREHLIEELGDLLAMIEIVQKVYDLDEWLLTEAKNKKFRKLKKWSTISESHLVHCIEPKKLLNSIAHSFKERLTIFCSRYFYGI